MTFTAEDFAGEWVLHRTIKDNLHGQNGTLAGQTVFTRTDASHLIYDEEGTLTLQSGVSLAASRRYLWAFEDEAVAVSFDEGRPFHQFVPSGHAAGTDHPCGEDFYTVRYDFTDWPRWVAVWTVTGPRKDYVSTSVYLRRDTASAIKP